MIGSGRSKTIYEGGLSKADAAPNHVDKSQANGVNGYQQISASLNALLTLEY